MTLDINAYINVVGSIKFQCHIIEQYLAAILTDDKITEVEETAFRSKAKEFLAEIFTLANTLASGEQLAKPTEEYTIEELEAKGFKPAEQTKEEAGGK